MSDGEYRYDYAAQRAIESLRAQLAECQRERDDFRRRIESAPHAGSYCRYGEGPCDCWKAAT